MHWASLEHDMKHFVALQWYGLQGMVIGRSHWWAALQSGAME
jgi:hypothetical protein